MPKPKFALADGVPMHQIEKWAQNPDLECVWAMHTCWWSLFDPEHMPYHTPGNGPSLPCDPRGSVLMQGNLAKFWTDAKENPEHYGKHGLDALVAAFHGNVISTSSTFPTSFTTWDKYNDLLDLKSPTP